MGNERENKIQARVIKKIKKRMPDSIVLKNDSAYQQGIPDLTVLNYDKWGFLEVKAEADSEQQPNQEYFVAKASSMSFGAFIYPENEEEVLDALQHALDRR